MSYRSSSSRHRSVPRALFLVGAVLPMMLVGLAAPVLAQSPQSITLVAPDLSADPGDTVDVRVDLSALIGVTELATIKFAVRADTTILEPLDARPGDALSAWPAEDFSFTTRGDRLGVSALTDPAVAVQAGSFVIFRFRVRDEVLDGARSPLDITATDDEQAIVLLTDPQQSPPGVKTFDVDGNLTITNGVTCLAGDASYDGSVTTADAVITLRVVTGLIEFPSIGTLCGADANQDGEIDVFDAAWILRSVVGLPVAATVASVEAARVDLAREGGVLQVRILEAQDVVALEARLRAEDGARWTEARAPDGALSLSRVEDSRLILGLARARGEDLVLTLDLEAGERGRVTLEHLRLFDASGATIDLEWGRVTQELAEEASPRRSFLSLGAYPNPFNPSTTLKLEMPRAGRARLEIFDVSGRHVATLLDQEITAGIHERVWQGRDDQGRSVSSGVYFARLVLGGDQARQRLLLVK